MTNNKPNTFFVEPKSGPNWYTQVWWRGDTLAARQYSLLRILALGHRERLDIVPLINGLAHEHRGYYSQVLSTLAARIETGSSLVSALEQTPDALSDEDVLALRLAGESGTWSQTFAELLKLRLEDQQASRLRPRVSKGYWLTLLFLFYFLMTLMLVIIAPTFKKMGSEMGIVAPESFLSLMRFTDRLNLIWLLLIAIVLVFWFTWFRAPQRFFQRQVAPTLLPPVAQQQIVELYRLLAIAVEAGRPLTGVLSTLARYHFNRRLRHRLLFVRNEVEQGSDVWQGLAQSQLLRTSEAQALSQSPNRHVTAWTLRELALKRFVIASRRTAGLAALVEPVLTLLFGAFVLWVCVAFFQYLVYFISKQS